MDVIRELESLKKEMIEQKLELGEAFATAPYHDMPDHGEENAETMDSWIDRMASIQHHLLSIPKTKIVGVDAVEVTRKFDLQNMVSTYQQAAKDAPPPVFTTTDPAKKLDQEAGHVFETPRDPHEELTRKLARMLLGWSNKQGSLKDDDDEYASMYVDEAILNFADLTGLLSDCVEEHAALGRARAFDVNEVEELKEHREIITKALEEATAEKFRLRAEVQGLRDERDTLEELCRGREIINDQAEDIARHLFRMMGEAFNK